MDKCSNCFIIDRAKRSYCPDCKKVKKTSQDAPMVDVLDKIRAELHATAELHDDGDYYLRNEWIDEIFDKYKAESKD